MPSIVTSRSRVSNSARASAQRSPISSLGVIVLSAPPSRRSITSTREVHKGSCGAGIRTGVRTRRAAAAAATAAMF